MAGKCSEGVVAASWLGALEPHDRWRCFRFRFVVRERLRVVVSVIGAALGD